MQQMELTRPMRKLSQYRNLTNEPPNLSAMLTYFEVSILSGLILAGYRVEQTKTELVIKPISGNNQTPKIIILPYGGRTMKGEMREYTSEDLRFLLSGLRIRLDCGHRCTIGHNFANTLIIISLGGGRLETYCHSCY